MMDSTYIFKIVIGGAGAVGKTTLLHRYLNGSFLPNTTMTIGVAFHAKEIYYENIQKRVKLSLWDLGGQERFRFLQSNYSAGARAGIVFFDMSRIGTITQVKNWVDMFRSHASPGIPIYLGGTKMDLLDDSQIDEVSSIAMETAQNYGLLCYVPTSSKRGDNVDALLQHIVDSLLARCQGPMEKALASTNRVLPHEARGNACIRP
nr:Rab family GTPase [Candidatus Sigynarchaeum springense]